VLFCTAVAGYAQSADPADGAGESAPAARPGSAVDAEISNMMQMLRDEGIDIDARMERARAICRDRIMAGQDEEDSIADPETAIANCAAIEQQKAYSEAINEMNANRQNSFAQAMAKHLAEVAEAERRQREYEAELAAHNAKLETQSAAVDAPATAIDQADPSAALAGNAPPPAPAAAMPDTPATEPPPAQLASAIEDTNPGSSLATGETRTEETPASVARPARSAGQSVGPLQQGSAIELAIMEASGPRIALIIGNEAYVGSMGALGNPVNDVVLIGATLRRLGFEVEILTDASQREMKEAAKRLGDRLLAAGENATGLFYYAGHGVQSQGINYLIPVGSMIDAESDLELEAVSADAILAQMEEAYVSTRIVILDACRNMPLRRRTRDGTRGLARMETPNGSFLAYSTSPGNTAADGGGIHSPFAEALAEQMLVPDRPIEVTFREVRRRVVELTNGAQVPWDSSSLLEKFSFAESN
jgi:hypothetical protein